MFLVLGSVFPPDGELHAAHRDHQGLLHGVLLPGCQAARLALHQEPVQYRLPQAFREVGDPFLINSPPSTVVSHAHSNNLSIISCSRSNRVTGVYEVTLCHVADNGSPGQTLSCYVA